MICMIHRLWVVKQFHISHQRNTKASIMWHPASIYHEYTNCNSSDDLQLELPVSPKCLLSYAFASAMARPTSRRTIASARLASATTRCSCAFHQVIKEPLLSPRPCRLFFTGTSACFASKANLLPCRTTNENKQNIEKSVLSSQHNLAQTKLAKLIQSNSTWQQYTGWYFKDGTYNTICYAMSKSEQHLCFSPALSNDSWTQSKTPACPSAVNSGTPFWSWQVNSLWPLSKGLWPTWTSKSKGHFDPLGTTLHLSWSYHYLRIMLTWLVK